MFLLESLWDREEGGEETWARKCHRSCLFSVSPSEPQRTYNTSLIACAEKVPLPRLELLNFAADGRLGEWVPMVSTDTHSWESFLFSWFEFSSLIITIIMVILLCCFVVSITKEKYI